MSMGTYPRRAAVLGAGVMGAQIAAHLANAEMEVLLYDLPPKEGDPSAVATQALSRLAKLDPKPLASRDRLQLLIPANYEQHLERLGDCDLVIEAIAERMDLKTGLFARIAPYLGKRAVLATNSSGLSVDRMAEALPEGLRHRFCGVHFFNPPRYMHLVELIPSQHTDPGVVDRLETFLVSTLGKGVVRAKDTPNFIANRIGVFSMVAAMHHTQQFGMALDEVDALTGPAIGRPKSATYRTADVVGLDTLGHVVNGSREVLADDPWQARLRLPDWLEKLIAAGALGQKTGAGIYRKQGKTIQVLDLASGEYRPMAPQVDPAVGEILAIRDPAEQFAALRASDHPQARFLWAIHRDVFHYAAYLLEEIADNARDLDLAVRWGFGWRRGPLEIWQAAGWRQVTQWINEDIQAGEALSDAPLPDWVGEIKAVHTSKGSWSAADRTYKARSHLPVYQRQLFPETVLGETRPDLGTTVLETDAVRLWHGGDAIAVLSFKSKQHVIGDDVLAGVNQALERAVRDFRGLVIWHPEPPFSLGANLQKLAPVVQAGDRAALEQAVSRFQDTALALRQAPIPVVAAVQGMALGGGCEFLLHCDRVVAALESYIGLVELGVGLIPAGGGSKELARRAALAAGEGDIFPYLRRHFETVAKAVVAKSAEEARRLGFLRDADPIVMNPHELLYVAKAQALALAEAGYRAPLPRPIRVIGRDGIANLKMMLINMAEGGFITEYDYFVASRLAEALGGGDVDPGSEVSEDWLLKLERDALVDLALNEKTQARIAHTLKTGKPLRN